MTCDECGAPLNANKIIRELEYIEENWGELLDDRYDKIIQLEKLRVEDARIKSELREQVERELKDNNGLRAESGKYYHIVQQVKKVIEKTIEEDGFRDPEDGLLEIDKIIRGDEHERWCSCEKCMGDDKNE